MVAVLLAGCDQGGSHLLVRNDWDRDVVIEWTTDQFGSVRVPARTTGTLFSSFANLSEGAEVRVFDDMCQLLDTLPFTFAGPTVYIGPSGDIELADDIPGPYPSGVEHITAQFVDANC